MNIHDRKKELIAKEHGTPSMEPQGLTPEEREEMEQIELVLTAGNATDSGRVFISHSKIYKQVPRHTSAEISLNRKEGKARAVVTMDLLDANLQPIEEPPSYFDMAVLEAVYSLINDGYKTVTAAQIFRKIRGNPNTNPNNEQTNEIDEAMFRLQATITAIKPVDQDGKHSKEAAKMLESSKGFRDSLLSFRAYDIPTHAGEIGYGYVFKGVKDPKTEDIDVRPLLLRQLQRGQYQFISNEVLNIKRLNEKTGQEKAVQLTNDRITIAKYLRDFCLTYDHSRGHSANRRTYAQIFAECRLEAMSRAQIKRYKNFIGEVLDHYQRHGLISGWSVYGGDRGVKIRTNEK